MAQGTSLRVKLRLAKQGSGQEAENGGAIERQSEFSHSIVIRLSFNCMTINDGAATNDGAAE